MVYKGVFVVLHNELFLRIITSFVGIPLIISTIYAGPPYIDILLILLWGGMLYEWFCLNAGPNARLTIVSTFVQTLVILLGGDSVLGKLSFKRYLIFMGGTVYMRPLRQATF